MIRKKDASKQPQAKRFEDAARELGCDEDEAHFEEKLKKIARQKPSPAAKDSKKDRQKSGG